MGNVLFFTWEIYVVGNSPFDVYLTSKCLIKFLHFWIFYVHRMCVVCHKEEWWTTLITANLFSHPNNVFCEMMIRILSAQVLIKLWFCFCFQWQMLRTLFLSKMCNQKHVTQYHIFCCLIYSWRNTIETIISLYVCF